MAIDRCERDIQDNNRDDLANSIVSEVLGK